MSFSLKVFFHSLIAKIKYLVVILGVLTLIIPQITSSVFAQIVQTKMKFNDKFRQLEESFPTPNIYRNAGGEPAFAYWQQKVDYNIKVRLDEKNRSVTGSEEINYHNNSPDKLRYIWLQLDQNRFKKDSISEVASNFGGVGARGFNAPRPNRNGAKISLGQIRKQQFMDDNELGFKINKVTDINGKDLPYVIVGTLMRINLDVPLSPASNMRFKVSWSYNLVEEDAVSARSGYEHFPKDKAKNGNDIFLIAQWYPRMVAYSDYEAWHNKEFIGRGEFTLEFGDYDVEITVPSDHIVSATGKLQNPKDVLTKAQRKRLQKAETSKKPVYIVTPDEALENEKKWQGGTKTWVFKAKNVRDFAFASSRKFIWDAQGHHQDKAKQKLVMAMSFFPKEGDPLWSKYSTAAVLHTLQTYSKYTFDFPYPTAQSVNGPVGGMEYPMITFNGPRTILRENGKRTYSRNEKRFLIGVVIHEVGHFYFPMIVNSDERQWTWMDEGLNTFLQSVAEQEWSPDYPSRRGDPFLISDFMASENQVPIMTNSETIMQFGNNAYGKPAAALFILRETILGRELFDFAFAQYANIWKFKRPTPYDFFRMMEEASGVDLDWFWRGWFFGTDHVDISIDNVVALKVNTKNPEIDNKSARAEFKKLRTPISDIHNLEDNIDFKVDLQPNLKDFYDKNDKFTTSPKDIAEYKDYLKGLKDIDRKVFERAVKEDNNYYILEFSNRGGLVMPIILELEFADGEKRKMYIPVEIWRRSPEKVRKLIITKSNKVLRKVTVDPFRETADTNVNNNYFPSQIMPSRLELFKSKHKSKDLMYDMMYDEIQDIKKNKKDDKKDKNDN